MTTSQAVEFMEKTGKPVKLVAPESACSRNGTFLKIFRDGRIYKLKKDAPVAATVNSISYDRNFFIELFNFDYLVYEEYVE